MGCVISRNAANPEAEKQENSLQKSLNIQTSTSLAVIKIIGNSRILTSAQSLIQEKSGKITLDYQLLNPALGKGAFGEVRKAIHKKSGIVRAIKIIKKEGTSKEERDNLLSEVQMLKQLDHPNILKVLEFYQDQNNFYIVSELCTGGELFEKIIKNNSFSEKKAAMTMQQILSAVHYCHKQNIVHRDLKPENILYDQPGENSILKIIDFGTSRVFTNNQKMTEKFGTPYYIAPEVLKKNYNYKCDLWSCGVILHILLVGRPPFNGPSEKSIMNKVQSQAVKLQGSQWNNISAQAKDLVKSLLNRDVQNRLDAKQALSHEWFSLFEFKSRSFSQIERVIDSMRKCIPQKRLGQATWIYLVNYLLDKDERQNCEGVFRMWDKDRDGKVSKEELIDGFAEVLPKEIAIKEVNRLMSLIDTDGNGTLEFSEFIAASIDRKLLLSDKKLRIAFSMLDKDGSECISINELKEVFGGSNLPDFAWKEIINEVDENGDGEISYQEFKEMMRKFA